MSFWTCIPTIIHQKVSNYKKKNIGSLIENVAHKPGYHFKERLIVASLFRKIKLRLP